MGLFKAKYKSEDPEVRLKAVSDLDDQNILTQLAKTDKSPRVRMAAVAKVDNQEHLVSIALNGKEIDARIAAVERVESQQQLAEIIRVRKNFQLMGACFARITDGKILEAIANDPEYNRAARRIAIENFADESYLSEVSEPSAEPGRLRSEEEIDAIIERHGGTRLVQAMGKFRGSPNAILTLGAIMRQGGEAALTAIEYLAQALNHANPEIRRCAEEQLATVKNASMVANLIRLCERAELHDKVMKVLGKINHPEARQFLKEKEGN
jgi:hypothetical protein